MTVISACGDGVGLLTGAVDPVQEIVIRFIGTSSSGPGV